MENSSTGDAPKDSPNISDGFGGEEEQNLKFPKRLRHNGRGKVLATIYKRPQHPQYRLYWCARVDGKARSRMKNFAAYSEAKRAGDKVVADVAKGRASVLSPGQAADPLNAVEELQRHYQATGKRLSIRFAVGEYCELSRKLGDRSPGEAVDGYLSTVAMVKRKDIKEAVEEFIASREPRTVFRDGKRPQLSPGWHYIVSMWLREFAATFPGHAVCDLSKAHLDTYIAGHNEVSSRTRNGRRNAVKLFLKWCAEQRDYLFTNNRLGASDSMVKEREDFGEVEFNTPAELRAMLDMAATDDEFRSLLPVLAIGGLAGLRLQEIASDVARHVPRARPYRSHFRQRQDTAAPAGRDSPCSRRVDTSVPRLRRFTLVRHAGRIP